MDEVRQMFGLARNVHFQDGFENQFSQWLVEYIKSHGEKAIHDIAMHITHESPDNAVVGEACRWIGYMEHPDTYESRRKLLEHLLTGHKSHYVRDGALLGLQSMDDDKSLPAYILAAANESNEWLRDEINKQIDTMNQNLTNK